MARMMDIDMNANRVSWSLFSERFKKRIQKENETLARYEDLPDDMHYEISQFLGASFSEVLQKVRAVLSPSLNPFRTMQTPSIFYDMRKTYSSVNELTGIEWMHNGMKVNIKIAYTYEGKFKSNIACRVSTHLNVYIDGKKVFEGSMGSFKKALPEYYKYAVSKEQRKTRGRLFIVPSEAPWGVKFRNVLEQLDTYKTTPSFSHRSIETPFSFYDYSIILRNIGSSDMVSTVEWKDNHHTVRVVGKSYVDADEFCGQYHKIEEFDSIECFVDKESIFKETNYDCLYLFQMQYPSYYQSVFY